MGCSYVIRMMPDYGFSSSSQTTWNTKDMFPSRLGTSPSGPDTPSPYVTSGFSYMQHALNEEYMKTLFPSNETFDTFDTMQKFGHQGFKDDAFLLIIPQFIPLLIMLSFIYTVIMIVKELVYEKERKLRECEAQVVCVCVYVCMYVCVCACVSGCVGGWVCMKKEKEYIRLKKEADGIYTCNDDASHAYDGAGGLAQSVCMVP